ncbi:MAG TPA: hypothetical protein PKC43_04785 [Phycisphaerales bacterium]|nr:hypothetical protein [Phycisphaerales bacterium]HMP36744.1 hypothetical protein [Phycisphaerales bacterium]
MTALRRFTRSRPTCTAAMLCSLLPMGCTGSLNTSDDLLDAPPTPALAGPLSEEQISAARAELAAGPRLTSLDRREWPLEVVSVPRGQVEHQPVYWVQLMPDRSNPRSRGDFPTAATALDGDGEGAAVALEAGANLASTPLFIGWAPIEMIAENRWPWTTLRNHPDYQRVPAKTVRDDWAWVTLVGSDGRPRAPQRESEPTLAPALGLPLPGSDGG